MWDVSLNPHTTNNQHPNYRFIADFDENTFATVERSNKTDFIAEVL